MAKQPRIGVTVALDGEKEFKQALSEINAGLKVNASQMQLVSATYEDGGKSVKDLAAAHEVLENQIASQTEKVQLLEKALANSVEKNGEASKKTMDWQVSLNKAQAELANMNTALEKNEEAMAQAGKTTTSVTDVINGFTKTVGLNVPPALQGMVDKLDGVSASGAALVGVVGGIIVGLNKLTINAAKAADDLATLSTVTGLSTDALQEFEYASNLIDVSTDTMTGSMTKLISTMRSARDGSESIAQAYQKLHIRITEGNGQLRNANTVFYQVVDALGKVRNETERDALAMQIFGKSAQELNPLIEAGSGKLRELAKEAHDVGYVMDEQTISKFLDLSDAMERMEKQGDALKNSFAVALLPMLTALFETLSKIPTPVLQTMVVVAGIVASIVLVVKAIKELTSTASTIKGFFSTMDSGISKTTITILGIVAALTALAAIIAVIMGKKNELESAMNSIGNTVTGMQSGGRTVYSMGNNDYPVTPILKTTSIPRYARGTNFHPGGLATINEGSGGGETIYLPRGSKVTPASQQTGGDTYNITIDAKNVQEFNDIVRIAQNQRRSRRMGYVGAN